MATRSVWQYRHVHEYLNWYKQSMAFLAENPNGRVLVGHDYSVGKDQFRRDFMKALNHRINLKSAPYPNWRNWDEDQYWRFWRDQKAIKDKYEQRVAIYQFETRAARKRLSHLLSEREG